MKKTFSSEFYDYVGKNNVFLDEVLSDEQRRCVANSNLEALLSYSCRAMNVGMVSEINFVRRAYKDYFEGINSTRDPGYYYFGYFPFSGDPRAELFLWKVNEGDRCCPSLYIKEKEGKGFVDLYATIYGKSKAEAFLALSQEHGVTENDLFNFFNYSVFLNENNKDDLGLDALPRKIVCGNEIYFFKSIPLYLCNTRGISGGMALYAASNCPENEMLLPCYVNGLSYEYKAPCSVCGNRIVKFCSLTEDAARYLKKSYLTIGVKNIGLLYGSEMFSELMPDSVVVLCESAIVAVKTIEHIKHNFPSLAKKYFVTTWWGGNKTVGSINFSYLEGKSVVFIPALNINSYVNAEKCYNKCKDSRVKSFLIVPGSLVGSLVPRRGELAKLKPYENYLAKTCTYISELNEFLFAEFISKALSFEEFVAVLKYHEFVDGKKSEAADSVCLPKPIQSLKFGKAHSNQLCFDDIINNNKICLVLGPNDSGKSIFVLSMVYAISHGVSMFGVDVVKPRNVLLIDGETSEEILAERYNRINSAYGSSSENSQPASLIVDGFPRGKLYDFSEEGPKNTVESYLESGKIDVLAFDNLNTLLPGNVQSPKKTSDFFAWIRKLELKYNVSIILVHHTKKEDSEAKSASGTKELEEKSQTIITVTHRYELEAKNKDKIDRQLRQCLDTPGALFKVYVKNVSMSIVSIG